MKYVLEIESPDFAQLLTAVAGYRVTVQQFANATASRLGRTHPHALRITADAQALGRVLDALYKAQDTATPERAVPARVARHQRAIDSDERAFVPGRPRNVRDKVNR